MYADVAGALQTVVSGNYADLAAAAGAILAHLIQTQNFLDKMGNKTNHTFRISGS